MATLRRPRNPLAIESPGARAARRAAIEDAIQKGALSGIVGSLHRRDILTERALLSYQREAEALWAREVDAHVLAAVGAILGTQAPAPGVQPVRGEPNAIPAPPRLPGSLAGALDRIVRDGAAPVWRSIETNLGGLVDQETAFAAKALVRHMGTAALADSPLARASPAGGPEPSSGAMLPPAAAAIAHQIGERAKAAPMFGTTVERAWGKTIDQYRDRVERVVGEAMQRGATNDQIVALLRGGKGQEGVLNGWRAHQIKAFVRTVGTHLSTVSREGSYAALGATHVQLIATLDLRTTIQCIYLDHTVWPIGEGPRPPIHPNCRTTVAPLWGQDSADSEVGTRASMDGPVAIKIDARQWFLDQPVARQEELVGSTRARLLRDGLEWRKLLGPGLEPLTNAQLREQGLLSA